MNWSWLRKRLGMSLERKWYNPLTWIELMELALLYALAFAAYAIPIGWLIL